MDILVYIYISVLHFYLNLNIQLTFWISITTIYYQNWNIEKIRQINLVWVLKQVDLALIGGATEIYKMSYKCPT